MLEKEKALELAVSQIEKQFGKGSIMRFGEASQRMAVDVIPTGALALDIALGIGGIPRGRIVEITAQRAQEKLRLRFTLLLRRRRQAEYLHL